MELFGGVNEAKLLDLSLLQSAANLLAPNIADFYMNNGPAVLLNVPAGTYRTMDSWIAVTLVKEEQFDTLCKIIEDDTVRIYFDNIVKDGFRENYINRKSDIFN